MSDELTLTSEVTIGAITTNAGNFLEAVTGSVQKFLSPDYLPDEATAKKDRAALNKLGKQVDEKRKMVEAAYNAPLADFLNICKEIKAVVSQASEAVDAQAKQYDIRRKEQRRGLLADRFNTLNCAVVPLAAIFDDRWLNKTVKLEDAYEEMENRIARIYDDLKTIEGLSDYATIAKSKYLETLDIGAAMNEVTRLKENAALLGKEKAERGERAAEAEERAISKLEMENLTAPRVDDVIAAALDEDAPEAFTFTFTFSGSRQQCNDLRQYMLKNGIPYEKIDMSQYQRIVPEGGF